MEKTIGIADCIKKIRERIGEIPQIIQTALENNEKFNKEYYGVSTSLSPSGFNIDDDYLIYDVFARYKPQSQIIYLDNIFLRLDQLDNNDEILKEVTNFVDYNCREENK